MTAAKVIPTSSPVNIVDIIGEIVSNVRTEYDTVAGEKPYYMHGNLLEMINTLKEYSNSDTLKLKKFPVIMLIEDIDSKGASGVFEFKSKLNLIIATYTSQDYKAANRYDNKFDTILTPLYDLFIAHAIKSNKLHSSKGVISHDPINRLYWGKKDVNGNSENKGDDFIDAIEIRNFEANIYRC